MGRAVCTVGAGCGWIRVSTELSEKTGLAGTLVYLTKDTTVADVTRDLVLDEEHTLWVKYGDAEGCCLKYFEKPLEIQDQFLKKLGYSDSSRRTRLGIDADLNYLISFFVGPKIPNEGGRGGLIQILKGLVVPQWRIRHVSLLGHIMFIHPQDGNSNVERVDLRRSSVTECGTKYGRSMIKVTTANNRNIFFGFDSKKDKDIWYSWFIQGSVKEGNEERIDLSSTTLHKIPEGLWMGLRQLDLGDNRLGDMESLESLVETAPCLTSLRLAQNKLNDLPVAVTKLKKLICLDVADNNIQQLPIEIAYMPSENFPVNEVENNRHSKLIASIIHRETSENIKLETLKLDRNTLRSLPDGPYKKLRSLSINHNKLESLPDFLLPIHMRALTLLDIDDDEKEKNEDEIRPEDLKAVNLRANLLKGNIILGNYGNLTQLDVSENSIQTLDLTALDKLQNVQCSKNKLQELSLNGNCLVSLIAGNNDLKKLEIEPKPSKLKHLDISYNCLESLPEWLGGCHHLRTLFASHNCLTSLPDHLFCSELSCLQTLQLSFNKLTTLPEVIRHIPLQQLFLQNNNLKCLPQHFFLASSRMRILNLSKNCLEQLPVSVGEGHQLERLYLTVNKLKSISSLIRFTNLRVLHVAYNYITQLPDKCVGSWPDMEELVLSGNKIESLPGNIVQWQHLRVLRMHSNLLTACPNLYKSTSLKVLDLAHNQLDKITMTTLVPRQLQSLDLAGNSRLHVDSRHFQEYRNQRKLCLIDVSGLNRHSLPTLPTRKDSQTNEQNNPWTLGFTETPGHRDRLCISQLRMINFCNNEALLGLFDAGNNSELPQLLCNAVPRILLEERTVKETANDYMKYTLLSAHRELKEKGQRVGMCVMLCHICRERGGLGGPRKMTLRIASVGEARAVLSRGDGGGTITLAHVPTQLTRSQLGNSSMFPMVVPDPHVTELTLKETDEFLIMANKRLWEVISGEEAVNEIKDINEALLAAKRLQDVAQSYGCEDNLSILVLKFNHSHQAQLIRELNYTFHKANELNCWCEPEGDRSSPSGQSDQASCSNKTNGKEIYNYRHYVADKKDLLPTHNYQSCIIRDKSSRKVPSKLSHLEDFVDLDDSSSEKSNDQLSEEQFRCWEYMLEQNTQMLFDKELDTISKGFSRRSTPVRTGLWTRSKSNPHLCAETAPECNHHPFLSRRFGSARSILHNGLGNGRRSINGGPNAAYFGSLQRLMPHHHDCDFSIIKERSENDSMETSIDDRMHKYWKNVTTTEL